MLMDLSELEIYLLTERKLAPATVLKTVQNVRRLESKNALSAVGFKKFTLEFLHSGKSKAYFNKYAQAIKHYCEFTHQAWAREITYFAEDEKIRDAFTDEEVEEFLKLPPPPKQKPDTYQFWQCFWYFCAATGCRPIEARKVEYRDIDLKNKIIPFLKTKTHLDREMPIGDRFLPILTEYMRSHPGNGYLFYYRDTGKMLTDASYLKDFHQRCERLRIKNRKPYSFRHSFGTRNSEISLKVLMGLMGHKNPKTTLRYVHDNIQMKRKAIQKDPFQDSVVSDEQIVKDIAEYALSRIANRASILWTQTKDSFTIGLKNPAKKSITLESENELSFTVK